MKEVLAVVPARGGSKGIPGKNLVDLCGRPLVGWTVAAALDSTAVTRVVVSTDSPEIASAAVATGAEVPFLRSAALSDGDVHAVHVVLDVVEGLERSEGYQPDIVLMLLPTTPLRRGSHIDDAVDRVRADPTGTVVGVYRWNRYLTNLRHERDGRLVPAVPAPHYNVQRQQQEPVYVVNGAMFAAATNVLCVHRSFHIEGAVPYVMSEEASIDINDEHDLERARAAIAESDLT